MLSHNDFDILFEDNSIIVCFKPAGVSSQTERGFDPDMVSLLSNYLSKDGVPPYVGVIHRLDKPVSGIMVYAKNKSAAASLSKELAAASFSKHYYAIVHANDLVASSDTTTLRDYLMHDDRSNSSSVVADATNGAKEAILEYKVINTINVDGVDLALLDIHLLTGRHHQIRVQLSHAGMPILGDKKYSIPSDSLPLKIKRTGLCLCAYSLSFTHPVSKKAMNFTSKPQGKVWKEFGI